MYENLALLALFVLVYSSVAGAVERTWISGPIIFTCFGLLIGPVALDLHTMEIDRETIRGLAEVTLALVLFTDAAGADMGVKKNQWIADAVAVDRFAADDSAGLRPCGTARRQSVVVRHGIAGSHVGANRCGVG